MLSNKYPGKIAMKKYCSNISIIVFLWALINVLYPRICLASNIVVELAQMSIEDLMQVTVSSVGFFDLPPEQSPGSIQIITTEQMENSPAIGLADIIELYVSGIHIGNTNTNGASYAVRGMRMSDNSTTVFMLDGNNINTSAGLGVNINPDLPLFGDISRLEVIKGPCSLVHGSGAMNGFVNFVPKNGSDYPGYHYRIQYGFKDHMITFENSYGLSYGHNHDVFIYLGTTYAKGYESQETYGFEKEIQDSDIPRSYNSRFFDPSFRMTLVWRNNNFRLTSFLHQDSGSSNAINDFLEKPSEYYQGMFITSLSWESEITDYETLEWNLPISLYDLGLTGEYIFPNRIKEEGGSECHVETRFVLKTNRFPRHSFAIGGLIGRRHFRANDYYLREDPKDEGRLLDSDWDEFGFFCEDVFHLSPKWHFSLGFRYDALENDQFVVPNSINDHKKITDEYDPETKEITTSRIAVSYNMSPDDTLKLSFQEGYHLSSMLNYYGIFFGNNNPQTDLEPELMSSLEFNFQHSEPEIGLQLGLNLFLNGYENSLLVRTTNSPDQDKLQNKNTPTGNGNEFLVKDIFANGPSFASMGGEIDLDWQITTQTDLFLSYAYSRPRNIDEEENLDLFIANEDCSEWISYPTHIFKAAIRQKALDEKILFNLHAMYTSAIDAISDNPNKHSQYYSPSVNIHASLSIKFSDQLTFQIIGRNIFDNDTPPIGFSYLEPWRGNLGEGSPLVYIGLSWKE